MTGGGSSATQSSHNQHRQASPLNAGLLQQQQMFHDGMMLQQGERKKSREIIHSGHFMVSDFEAEGHDDDEVAIPVPEDAEDGSGTSVLGAMVVSSSVNPAGDLAGNSPVGAGSSAWAKKSDSSTSGKIQLNVHN